MLDASAKNPHRTATGAPPLDFQEHLRLLDARGLVTRIDRPIDKDSELHPLVRWQFQGGLAEDERRAFLFTNVVDSAGRRYDIPVAVGALAASPEIYAVGMGRPVADIGEAWTHAVANPIPPMVVASGACQEVVIKGADLLRPGEGLARLPVPISTPGFDSAPYLTATLCITRDPDTGVQNMGTYRAALKAQDRLGVRMSSRPGGAGGYLHWQKYQKRKEPMPCAIVIGCAPVVLFTGPQKLPIDQDEMAVAGGLGRRAHPHGQSGERRLICPRRRRDRHRGSDRQRTARAGRPVRRKPRPRRAGRFQHVDAGDRDHAQAGAGLRLDHQPGDAERIERHEEGGVRADVPRPSARSARGARDQGAADARALHQLAQGHLPAIRARDGTNGSLARAAWRGVAARRLRQDLHCGQRGHRPGQYRCDLLVAGLSLRSRRGCPYRALPLGRTRTEIGRAGRLDDPDRRHAQARHAAAGLARSRIHGTRARALERAGPAGHLAAVAVARLFARRLGRAL